MNDQGGGAKVAQLLSTAAGGDHRDPLPDVVRILGDDEAIDTLTDLLHRGLGTRDD